MTLARSLCAVGFTCALVACSDDTPPALELREDASTPAARGLDANVFENPTLDANVDYEGGPLPGNPAVDDATSTQDRCYGETCTRSALLEQEDLEFLEPMGEGWLRLMEADWEVAPMAEGYRCMTFTIPEDVFITAFFPQSPPGTHHATLTVSDTADAAEGVVACGVGGLGARRLQGSGAGTEPNELPEGVAQPLRAGQQVTMNLHLFNVTEAALRGRSGVWVKTIPGDEVVSESETILAGPISLDIPVGESTQTGQCTIGADVTLYSIGPHMHQLGVHMRITATTASGEIEIHDGPYDFTHQVLYAIDPIDLKAGDVVRLECTYLNDTDSPVSWGDSSLAEMCFVSLSVYPGSGLSGGPPCGA